MLLSSSSSPLSSAAVTAGVKQADKEQHRRPAARRSLHLIQTKQQEFQDLIQPLVKNQYRFSFRLRAHATSPPTFSCQEAITVLVANGWASSREAAVQGVRDWIEAGGMIQPAAAAGRGAGRHRGFRNSNQWHARAPRRFCDDKVLYRFVSGVLSASDHADESSSFHLASSAPATSFFYPSLPVADTEDTSSCCSLPLNLTDAAASPGSRTSGAGLFLDDHADTASIASSPPLTPPPPFSLTGGSSSPDHSLENKDNVKRAIEAEIERQQRKGEGLQKLVDHNRKLAVARLRVGHDVGALLSWKLVLRHDADRKKSAKAAKELKEMLESMDTLSASDMQVRMEAILAVPPPTYMHYDAVEDILRLAAQIEKMEDDEVSKLLPAGDETPDATQQAKLAASTA